MRGLQEQSLSFLEPAGSPRPKSQWGTCLSSAGPLSWGAWCGTFFVISFHWSAHGGGGPGKLVFVTFTCLNMAPPPFLWKWCSVNTCLEVLLGETCCLYSCSFGVSMGGSELRIIRLYHEPGHQPSFEISLKPKFSSFLYMEVILVPLLLRFWTGNLLRQISTCKNEVENWGYIW